MSDLKLSNNVTLAEEELEFSGIRAQGSGGQNVNKVSSAVHLRFDIMNSSLPDFYKERLMALNDQRISKEGIVVIKAQQHRSQLKNKDEALARLVELIKQAVVVQKTRKATKPSRSSQRKRLDSKKKRSQIKALRGRID